jgi:phosphate transport system permease protein
MRPKQPRFDFIGNGLTALCGGALAFNLLLVVALLVVLGANGLGYFWQKPLLEVQLADGRTLLGEERGKEAIPNTEETRIRLRVGNRDVDGIDFVWVDEPQIESRSYPDDVVMFERQEWGNFYGRIVELRRDDELLASGIDEVWQALGPLHDEKVAQREAVHRLVNREIGDVNHRIEKLRLEEKRLELKQPPADEHAQRMASIQERDALAQSEFEALSRRLVAMREEMLAETLVVEASDGTRKEIEVGNIVRALRPNAMGAGARAGLYLSRVWEFVAHDPRESNTEGGIFPAIFGTVTMVFIMSFAVAPLGVLAALYLREYAKQGPMVRLVRIAVNNLAGVPSIVFGVFGLGFFVYTIGGSLDRLLYPEALPRATFGTGGILWGSLTLALLTVPVVIVATEEGLAAVPRIVREGSLALGATKFETTWRVVIPAAAPGMMTGMILAMARAAGEVAPLMIVGMVKLAPALPMDRFFPFVHLERKFMHMGFHIYDVGFQSPDVEATKPIVFATALLLILVVTAMNLIAIAVRNHLRSKYASSAV